MPKCKLLRPWDRIFLRFFGRRIRKDAIRFYEETKNWKVKDYIEYSEAIINENLNHSWNKRWKRKIGDFDYSVLKKLEVTEVYPEIKPSKVVARTLTTGTVQSKRIYYTKFDVYHFWVIKIKYVYKLGAYPFRTSIAVTSGYTADCEPFTTTLLGEVAGYMYGAKNLHLTYDRLDEELVRKFVGRYGPIDRIFVFVTYLYRFVNHIHVEDMIHNDTVFATSGDVLTYNVYSAIKRFYERYNVDRFKIINLYGASEVGLVGFGSAVMSDWDPRVQNLEFAFDSALPTFREINLETGEIGDEILLLDEIKEGRQYIIYMTALKSVFVPNYDVGDLVSVEKKTGSELIIRVIGRYGRPLKIAWRGEEVVALEQSAIKLSGVSISSVETINTCGKVSGGPCIIIVDSRDKKIWIYTEKKLDLLEFSRACRENPNTISLLIALEQGWELKNVYGDEAKEFMNYFFEIKKKRTGILFIPSKTP